MAKGREKRGKKMIYGSGNVNVVELFRTFTFDYLFMLEPLAIIVTIIKQIKAFLKT